ncbi:hypothetical protein ACRDE1_004279 [Cronobacter sakazakii]
MSDKRDEVLEKLLREGLGADQSAPAFIEAVAMALGYTNRGSETAAEALSRIGDALDRIATALEKQQD